MKNRWFWMDVIAGGLGLLAIIGLVWFVIWILAPESAIR